mmetsp:Transcript_3804/g.8966  ORF Transcript_3804/g.8966 Transcript_3804/m.8966 type:complete len:213 (-) Transcript_3804:3538-4176(-)
MVALIDKVPLTEGAQIWNPPVCWPAGTVKPVPDISGRAEPLVCCTVALESLSLKVTLMSLGAAAPNKMEAFLHSRPYQRSVAGGRERVAAPAAITLNAKGAGAMKNCLASPWELNETLILPALAGAMIENFWVEFAEVKARIMVVAAAEPEGDDSWAVPPDTVTLKFRVMLAGTAAPTMAVTSALWPVVKPAGTPERITGAATTVCNGGGIV